MRPGRYVPARARERRSPQDDDWRGPLNGGLFEEDDDEKNEEIKVPDKAVGAVLKVKLI
jgi:hypothetical protein